MTLGDRVPPESLQGKIGEESDGDDMLDFDATDEATALVTGTIKTGADTNETRMSKSTS